jgi:plastocyanin
MPHGRRPSAAAGMAFATMLPFDEESMHICSSRLIAVLLLLAVCPAWAVQTFTVTVGPNGNLTFSPSSLPQAGDTVHVGDTITFTNGTSGGFHNAHSTDAAFSFECGSAGCSNSAPNSGLWSASVSVPASAAGKTILYICDQHGSLINGVASGMAGSITVAAATTPVTLQTFGVE